MAITTEPRPPAESPDAPLPEEVVTPVNEHPVERKVAATAWSFFMVTIIVIGTGLLAVVFLGY